jgi:hypothetical protein
MYLHNSSLALVLYSSVLCAMQQEYRPKLIPRRERMGKQQVAQGMGILRAVAFAEFPVAAIGRTDGGIGSTCLKGELVL